MKKLYISMMAVAMGAMAADAAGLSVTFDGSDNELWSAGDVAVVADGHLSVEMPLNGTKYRQDISFNNKDNAYHFTAEDKIVAVKFIGDRPATCRMTFEIQRKAQGEETGDKWLNNLWKNNSNDGKIVTSGGNTIYVYDLSRHENYLEAMDMCRVNIKMADCTDENDRTYVIDWIKSYPSVEAVEADKDWKDDGTEDADEASVAAMPVMNVTTGVGYNTLQDAWDAASTDNVIEINENQTINSRLNANGRTITLQGKTEGVTISRSSGYNGILILTSQGDLDGDGTKENASVTVSNLIFDGIDKETSVSFEASNKGSFTCDNCEFRNFKSNNNQGVVSSKSSGRWSFNGAVFTNCSVPEGRGILFNGNGTTGTLAGAMAVESIYLEKTAHINGGEGLSAATPITLYFDAARDLEAGALAVAGCNDATAFRSGVENVSIKAEGNDLVLVSDNSGIDEAVAVEAAEAAPVYYNLQGVRVAVPEHGLYIVVRGDKVAKEMVK